MGESQLCAARLLFDWVGVLSLPPRESSLIGAFILPLQTLELKGVYGQLTHSHLSRTVSDHSLDLADRIGFALDERKFRDLGQR